MTTLAGGRIRRLHIDQHRIRANRKNGTDEPPITIQTSRGPLKAHEVSILADDGSVLARIVYRPQKPLSCGAHVWVETSQPLVMNVRDVEAEPLLS